MIPNEANLNLGMIGNCTISALIDAQARMVWCCMPRFDSDPVFHALLDSAEGIGEEGSFQIVLDGCVRTEQAYDENTAILRTRLFDHHDNAVEVDRLRAALHAPRALVPPDAAGAARAGRCRARRASASCCGRAPTGAAPRRRAPAAATTCASSRPTARCG